MTTTFGPIELIELGFVGNKFTGGIAAALADLVDRGIVRIIDLAVVTKDADGTVGILEAQEYTVEFAAAMATLTGDVSGLLSEADLLDLAAEIAPSSTIAVLMVEHLWAMNFALAVREAGGELLMSQRISNDLVEATRDTLLAAAG